MRAPISLLAILLSLGCAASEGETLETGPLGELSASSSKADALPAGMTNEERVGKADGYDPRDEYPGAYGFTNPPTGNAVLAGEFEPAEDLYIGWGSGAWENEQFLLDIVAASADVTNVTIVVPDQTTVNYLDQDMAALGMDPNLVNYLLFPLDSIWMRDYGPLGVETSSGRKTLVDPRYYWGRWMDDYFPTALGGSEGTAVSRAPIEMEGGNLQSDGAGRCVTSDVNTWRNADFGYTEQDIRDLFKAYYGCAQTTIVPAMLGEGTGHVDMSVHITGPGQVIVGKYSPQDDSENAKRLEITAQRLAADGFLVRRVNMPRNDGRQVFRSYTNALAVNGRVLVPVYDEDTRYQNQALAVFKQAYPNHDIVPINSDGIIYWSGAIHCVTMTLAD